MFLKINFSTSILAGASVKVIQLLQHFEQLSTVFAQAVSVWSTEYGIRAIVGEVIRLVNTTCGKKNKAHSLTMTHEFQLKLLFHSQRNWSEVK